MREMQACRTPATNSYALHGSKSKKRSISRVYNSDVDAIVTPDRFVPCRSHDQRCGEFSSHEISKSVRKNGKRFGLYSNNQTKDNLLLDRQNIRRMLTFNTPSPLNGKGYWEKYASKQTSMYRDKRRKINTTPDSILNAPDVIDDFYLNLLHWGNKGLLAVGLGHSAYMLRPRTLEAIPLFGSSNNESSFPSAVRWNPSGCGLAVGLSNAELQIWDPEVHKILRTFKTHSSRIGCLSWHPKDTHLLSASSQSGDIHLYDARTSWREGGYRPLMQFRAHEMDVCSLQWSPSGRYLASGGNDNVVNIWNTYTTNPWERPVLSFKEHTAAVKALSWSPWKNNLIATGGGTADKTLHLWNVVTGNVLRSVDTKSQISGIVWSSEHRELLTSHGYEENALMIWDPEILQDPVAVLQGHSGRILHLTISPDEQEVATVAADNTLRIWKCFSSCKKHLNFDTTNSKKNSSSFERDLTLFGL